VLFSLFLLAYITICLSLYTCHLLY